MSLTLHETGARTESFAFRPMDSKILGVGNPFLDRVVHVRSIPQDLKKGETSLVFERKIVEQFWETAYGTGGYAWSLGGSCTNVIKVLSHLISILNSNQSCSLLGMVGKDQKQEIEKELLSFGVEPLLNEGDNDNGIVNCFVTPDAQRTMQTFLGASLEFSEKHVTSEAFKNVAHVHLEGYLAYFNGVLEKSIKLAKENGAAVSLDLSSVDVITQCRDQIKKCADEVDIIFGNILEMKVFTGCKDVSEIIKKFHSRQIVVITDGSRGGWVKAAGKEDASKFDALKVDHVVDTTGAGDFFIAGFLAEFLDKKDVQTCIKAANLAASFVIQHDGTDLPQQEWDKLKKQMNGFK